MNLRISGCSRGLSVSTPSSVSTLASLVLLCSACSEQDVSTITPAPLALTPAPSEQPGGATVVARPSPATPAPGEPAGGSSVPSPPPPAAPEAPPPAAVEPGTQTPAPEPPSASSLYALSTLVFGPEGTTSYVRLLDSLRPSSVTLDDAREFPGTADLWVNEGEVFVAEGESRQVTKFAVQNRQLVAQETLSFASYGLTSLGFWLNAFASPTQAYLFNGAAEIIVWNPTTMEITGTIPLPALPAPAGLQLMNGYSDRSAVVREGRLSPLYWADETFFEFGPRSAIAVVDVASNTLIETLDAPCPGLDYATQTETGDIYFSSWVYAAGGAAVLAQPSTCVVRLAAGSEVPEVAFRFADVTGGREGAALRYLRDGRSILSVLHADRVTLAPDSDPSAVTFAANWRFWLYDDQSRSASPIESIDWNAGAQYSFDIDGRTLMLVAEADYSSTSVYDVGNGSMPTPLFETPGWSVRLFKLR